MKVLSFHSAFSWVSQYVDRAPYLPQLAFLSRIHEIPFIGSYTKRYYNKIHLIPQAVEPNNLSQSVDPNFHYYHGFWRRKTEQINTVSESICEEFRNIFARIQSYQQKERIIAKYTTKPSIAYFNSIFPRSAFIHITRSGHAVVNSLHNKVLEAGWFVGKHRELVIQTFPPRFASLIEESNHPTIAFLSCFYCHLTNTIREGLSMIDSNRWIEVTYENFTIRPRKELGRILEFLELDWTSEFGNVVKDSKLENRNYKYMQNLSPGQIKEINEILETCLEH